MCGIAGIMFKKGGSSNDAGEALIEMLDGCQHRGPDSTGFALYGEDRDDYLHLRFFVGMGDADAEAQIRKIKTILDDHGAKLIHEERQANHYRVVVDFSGDSQKLSYALEHAAKVVSIGRSLEILKDVGGAHDIDANYDVHHFKGTHGLGHVRLATESDVNPEAAHPFWATGFEDVAIVHNGQITNYWKMRRRLERHGFEFHTDNDSELIAVYIAEKLRQGHTLKEALKMSVDDLDGTFSFLVSTKDEIGYAKDHLAAKPMIMYEDDNIIALASEEVSLNRLFPGKALNTSEPPPGTYDTWSRST